MCRSSTSVKHIADLGVTMLAAGIGNIHGKYPENWAGLQLRCTLDDIQKINWRNASRTYTVVQEFLKT